MQLDSAVEGEMKQQSANSGMESTYVDAVSMAADSVAGTVSEQIRSTTGSSLRDEDLRPRVGLCWLSCKEADAFVCLAGAAA